MQLQLSTPAVVIQEAPVSISADILTSSHPSFRDERTVITFGPNTIHVISASGFGMKATRVDPPISDVVIDGWSIERITVTAQVVNQNGQEVIQVRPRSSVCLTQMDRRKKYKICLYSVVATIIFGGAIVIGITASKN